MLNPKMKLFTKLLTNGKTIPKAITITIWSPCIFLSNSSITSIPWLIHTNNFFQKHINMFFSQYINTLGSFYLTIIHLSNYCMTIHNWIKHFHSNVKGVFYIFCWHHRNRSEPRTFMQSKPYAKKPAQISSNNSCRKECLYKNEWFFTSIKWSRLVSCW